MPTTKRKAQPSYRDQLLQLIEDRDEAERLRLKRCVTTLKKIQLR